MSKPRVTAYWDLIVWQRAMGLAEAIYQLTERFPSSERFGLVAQMRRAAVSVASNVAEGHSRGWTRDYLRFIMMARGSVAELETQCLLAQRLGFVADPQVAPVLAIGDEVGRMLAGLRRRLRARLSRDNSPLAPRP